MGLTRSLFYNGEGNYEGFDDKWLIFCEKSDRIKQSLKIIRVKERSMIAYVSKKEGFIKW